MKRYFIQSFLCIFLFIFSAVYADNDAQLGDKKQIQGNIADGRYYSYEKMFSIAFPGKLDSIETKDFYAAPNSGGVVFINKSGFLLKLEMDQVIPEVTYLVKQHPEIKQEILDALFYEVLIPQLKAIVPNMHLVSEQKLKLANGDEALFAVVDFPRASVLTDQSGKPLDLKRGMLLFLTNNNKELVNLSVQDATTFIPNAKEGSQKQLQERLLNHLIYYHTSFRLEKSQDHLGSRS